MKALGANIAQIIWVFLGQEQSSASSGTLTGLGLGMTLIRYRNEFSHWLASTLHIEIFPREVLSIFVDPGGSYSEGRCHHLHQRIFYLLVCGFDSRLLRARLDPVKALRYE